MPSRFAHRPLEAVRSCFAERKPSGILSATVLSDRDASVSSSFPSRLSLGGHLDSSAMFAKREGIPLMKGEQAWGGSLYVGLLSISEEDARASLGKSQIIRR
jgi:hypothetical protein